MCPSGVAMFAPSVQLNAVCPAGTWARVEPRISGCQSQSPSISPAARLEVRSRTPRATTGVLSPSAASLATRRVQ